MFSYYGSKANIVRLYPKPRYPKIKEAFAGSGRFSLEHFEHDVLLVDKWPVIIDVWKWLQQCSTNDILSLPRRLTHGDSLHDITFDCQAQKDFYGFIVGAGAERPRRTVGYRRTTHRPNAINHCLKETAAQLYKIKHWNFVCGDYLDMVNEEATWFIDPPYQHGGHKYTMSNAKIDFTQLAQWCNTRQGDVIVCENTKADWLPFIPLIKQRGSNATTTEAIFTNFPTHFHNIQHKLF